MRFCFSKMRCVLSFVGVSLVELRGLNVGYALRGVFW